MAERDRLCGGPLRGTHGRPRAITGIHLDYIALREESLGSALTRVRDALEDDDRHLAATLAGQRAGERPPDCATSASPVCIDDPEKLRELRQQRAERKAERQQQSKGRHWSMRI